MAGREWRCWREAWETSALKDNNDIETATARINMTVNTAVDRFSWGSRTAVVLWRDVMRPKGASACLVATCVVPSSLCDEPCIIVSVARCAQGENTKL